MKRKRQIPSPKTRFLGITDAFKKLEDTDETFFHTQEGIVEPIVVQYQEKQDACIRLMDTDFLSHADVNGLRSTLDQVRKMVNKKKSQQSKS